MDFELTGSQREYRDRARAIAQDQLLAGYQGRERDGRIEPELRRELGRLGLIAPELPAELGGQGTDRLTTGVITEQIGRGDINVAYLQVVGSLVAQILAGHASAELAKQWVPRICSGEQIVGIGLTEPHAGSDAGNPRLTAVRDGPDWILDGTKSLSFGHGYRTELPVEQRLRDVLGLQIGDGTAQIMKLVIARHYLGRELAP